MKRTIYFLLMMSFVVFFSSTVFAVIRVHDAGVYSPSYHQNIKKRFRLERRLAKLERRIERKINASGEGWDTSNWLYISLGLVALAAFCYKWSLWLEAHSSNNFLDFTFLGPFLLAFLCLICAGFFFIVWLIEKIRGR